MEKEIYAYTFFKMHTNLKPCNVKKLKISNKNIILQDIFSSSLHPKTIVFLVEISTSHTHFSFSNYYSH